LFLAWNEFRRGKRHKEDVMLFEKNLEQHIFQLHRDLRNKTYTHGTYSDFYINDPKRRHIHKATVRDRVLHHALFQILNRIFEPTFIARSFSCRVGKGTHKGVQAVRQMIQKVSKNNTHPCYVLKCDVRKFFDSIDHTILLGLLQKQITDEETLWLLKRVIGSYESGYTDLFSPHGLPIGNLTSQLFANVYMNEFDQFMKHTLKVKEYARYTDDFIIVSGSPEYLQKLIKPISEFLKLHLHPEKVDIFKLKRGIDFLGSVLFPYHTQIRKKTKKRIIRKLRERITEHNSGYITKESLDQTIQSYLGVLSHTNSYKLGEELKNTYWYKVNK
jgi:retron-type reverse transcriptase